MRFFLLMFAERHKWTTGRNLTLSVLVVAQKTLVYI